GVYSGKLLKQNILLHLIRMAGLGGVIILVIYLLFRIKTGQSIM
ncbi:MAG: hypothetical protein C5S44_00090, partial [Candidatus Methanocomedens sp.]